jgi:hypothetical protein
VAFTAEQLPKVKFFWSASMYRLPERLLVTNPIDRYSIGDRTQGLRYGDDGSLTLTSTSAAEPAAAVRFPSPAPQQKPRPGGYIRAWSWR